MTGDYYIGLMSGTSLDAIDVVLCQRQQQGFQQIAGNAVPLPTTLRQQLLTICSDKHVSLQTLGEVDQHFAICCAEAINLLLNKQKITAKEVSAIGSHGQTIYHSPTTHYAFTQQIGDGNIIAARTQIPCVTDFRRMDMAYGGQGAPLVPAFHQALFAKAQSQRVILNIGGIANISILNGTASTLGFDTGPGNLLMDAWINCCQNKHYDKNAQFAMAGKVNEALLEQLLSDPYFMLSAPKSTGREKFNLSWLLHQLHEFTLDEQDIQRTLLELTSLTIARQIQQQVVPCEIYVCGGGALNPLLMQRLTHLLANYTLDSTSALGIDPMYVEAVAFAWLAEQRIAQQPVALCKVTGARKDAILGCVYQP